MADIKQLIGHLRDLNLGVLITDHNATETLDIVDRAYIIVDGKITLAGTPTELVNNQTARELYFGHNFSYRGRVATHQRHRRRLLKCTKRNSPRHPRLLQKKSITPRLQEALKVLNMPLQELTHFIRQKREQNPFFGLEDEDETTSTVEEPEELDPAPEWNEPEGDVDQEDTTVDIDWETVFEDRVSLSERMNSRPSDSDEPPPDTAYECSLHDYLLEQLDFISSNIITSEMERAIAEHILGNLNDDGKLELKLFQIPCEFLTTLDLGDLSAELHVAIQEGLQTATGNNQIKFSKASTIAEKKITYTPPENAGAFIKCIWKINDPDNNKTYTIKYEQTSCRCKRISINSRWKTLAKQLSVKPHLLKLSFVKYKIIFEPVGIAHRDTREALLIQIRTKNLKTYRK